MKKKILSLFKYFIFLFIGIGLLWLVFRNMNPQDVYNKIENANYSWIILSMVLGGISHMSRAIRWKMLIAPLGYNPRNTSAFFAVMIGYFANLAFPRMGEIVRCGILKKYENIPFNSLVGTVIVERAIDLIFLIVLAILTIIFQLDLLKDFLVKFLIDPILSMIESNLLMIVLIVFFILLIAYLIIKSIIPKIKRSTFFYKIKKIIVGFLAGLKTIKKMKNSSNFILHTFFIWLMYLAMIYVCFSAFNGTSGLDLKAGISILVIGSIGIIAPVPGGIGTYHSFVKVALEQIYDIVPATANAFVIIVHSSQLLLITFLGVISLILLPLIAKNSSKHEKF